ncbi:related to long-chain fatty-acid-CoA ligase [Phialocephala subalpina]|uniref:Related to long-chain fatty-acid-CoA ligase n=1 Tax=Phialocephala subalpina TaxID=576137 RepID=A0A1L7XCV1_9HELO|nr:related to long-chain fatty-acid-CoA ligase [Phialocephala subalpina]
MRGFAILNNECGVWGRGGVRLACVSATVSKVEGSRIGQWQFQNSRKHGRFAEQRRSLLTSSHAKGPLEPPLLTQTIAEHFSSIVSAHGDRTAFISRSENARLTYSQLDDKSNHLAHGLRDLGVRKGDRVAVMLGNSWAFGVVTYAVWKLGAVLHQVPLNPAFNSPQVIAALSHLSAAHLIISTETNLPYKPPRENISLLQAIVPDLSISKIESPSVPSLKNIILVDNSSEQIKIRQAPLRALTPFDSLTPGPKDTTPAREVVPDEPLHKDDIINIQFTSGTTSHPKAACLTHHSILNNGYSIGARMKLTPEDIMCVPPPLFHCFGSILGYMATATHGSAILWPSESFNAEATMRSIQEEKATGLYGVATMFVACLELLAKGTVENKGFEHLRTGIAAGSSVPSHLMEKLHDKLNLTGLTICYGMTETSPVSCMTTLDDPLEKRVDSVGRLLPHVEAKVVDAHDRTKILPIGERGELVVSGYNVMKYYWGDPEKTAEVRVEEIHTNPHTRIIDKKIWMHTGDEAMMDEEGYVRITGRIKDLIIRGGENIHPLEVENCLFKMEQVSEASVVGLPDERYGEVVAAFVVPHGNIQTGVDDAGVGDEAIDKMASNFKVAELRNWEAGGILTREMVREWVGKELSNHLVPKYVFWIDEYPKTASGKIQKFKLREVGVRLLEDTEVDSLGTQTKREE